MFREQVYKNTTKIIFYVLILLFFYILIFRPLENNLFNYRFVDEEDSFITGKWVLQGKKLYDNLYFQHQPIPTLLSSGIQTITRPNTLFLLVKRHREFIFFFSLVTWILLIVRFGKTALISGLLIELVKHSFLGHIFLAEALVIPAIVYLILLTFNAYSGQVINKIDLWLIPICLIYLQFSLLPLSTFTLAVFTELTAIGFRKSRLKLIAPFVVSGILFILLILPTISLRGYIQTTIISNFSDFIPNELSKYSLVNKFIFVLLKPIEALIYLKGSLGTVLLATSVVYLFFMAYFIACRKWTIVFLAITFPILLNFRPQPINDGYAGFHLLPWFAGLVIVTVHLLVIATRSGSDKLKILSSILLFTLLASSASHALKEYRQKPNPFDQWYVNYSTAFDYGQALNELSRPNDTLLTAPNGSLIYWQSGIGTASRFFFIYSFMYNNKYLLEQISQDINSRLPSFIYYEGNLETDQLLRSYADKYTPILKDKKNSWLFVEQSRYSEISDLEWKKISRYGFSKQ